MPPTRAALRNDLDQLVALRVVRPVVDGLRDDIQREAQRRAPAAKGWMTSEDERVRRSHAEAEGQTIPENLRYKLQKMTYVRGSGRGRRPSVPGHYVLAPGHDLARAPRDDRLPAHQKMQCRCESVELPGLVAASIHGTVTVVSGRRVQAEVYSRFNRIAESEFGTGEDVGAHFMGGAVQTVAQRFRSISRPRR